MMLRSSRGRSCRIVLRRDGPFVAWWGGCSWEGVGGPLSFRDVCGDTGGSYRGLTGGSYRGGRAPLVDVLVEGPMQPHRRKSRPQHLRSALVTQVLMLRLASVWPSGRSWLDLLIRISE